ncbi:hypothetical protein [Streptomyces sp. NPDC053367]|uniref:hypothetical protein n=1 Tax=Streptomyces sp. NPDC053367 TaxID=3365700 RepID=UPI0037D4C26F
MSPGRYYLTLLIGGRPVQHGWWADQAVALRKFTEWVGERGRPGARITLVDEETNTVVTTWPEQS